MGWRVGGSARGCAATDYGIDGAGVLPSFSRSAQLQGEGGPREGGGNNGHIENLVLEKRRMSDMCFCVQEY